MTIEQFDKIVGYLIGIVLPPNVSNDLPVSAEQVLEVLEKHCEIMRGLVIHERQLR